MRIPKAIFGLVREAARHILRRPVIGITAIARVDDGRLVLIRRGDTGEWCLPGGTLDWGETLRDAITRELLEEAGVRVVSLGRLVGVVSRPDRDPRMHGVSVVVEARVTEPSVAPMNSLEVLEVGLFADAEVPAHLAFHLEDALRWSEAGTTDWE